jgi:hypothetical protein
LGRFPPPAPTPGQWRRRFTRFEKLGDRQDPRRSTRGPSNRLTASSSPPTTPVPTRDSANHERPREEWIEISVPALIDEPTFARAQELLHENKVRARRRTIQPSLAQGLVGCRGSGCAVAHIDSFKRTPDSLLSLGGTAAPRIAAATGDTDHAHSFIRSRPSSEFVKWSKTYRVACPPVTIRTADVHHLAPMPRHQGNRAVETSVSRAAP